ncbi:hypothetical protein [Prevotella sp. HUN102]|uniref:hypothetical protein n=1 Tax=Prevotella sp. HUN102 TaxID=1392486 RepID=UPI00048C8798|nr:hypothetical protein [Prevotella sp. HUN102]
MFTSSDKNEPVYKTLSEIRLRKAQLLTDITKDNNQMAILWNGIFHKPKEGVATPSKRFAGLMKSGAGIVDGLILGWKLYRKFGGNKGGKTPFSLFGKKK